MLQDSYAQTAEGVVALDIPARNSLTFNRSVTNPTFTFVREQNNYITITNKRELLEIDDAPQTYLVNYSGRFRENVGAGIFFFQQNFGVLTAFGGMVNFAYNAQLAEESNLTFGINIGAYKSGLNNGNVQTNFDDPALNTIPSNFLLTANPGLNYGTGFLDFGVSLNNLITYNFETSNLVENNPKRGVQGHIMYTGYFGGYGFFGESRFSALARTEFQKETSIYSGVVMLTVPKGIWAQVGYNTLYGASGGLGVNITKQIAIEYNYERPFSGLSNLGAAHEITLAYRFKNNNYYEYSRDDDLAGIFSSENRRTPKKRKSTPTATVTEEITPPVEESEPASSEVDTQAQLAAEEQARLEAEEEARVAAEEFARLEEENRERQRLEAQERARIASENEAQRLAEENAARLAAEETARQARLEQERLAAEETARQARLEQERLAAEEQERIAAEEQQRLAAEAQLAAQEQERIAAESQAALEAKEQERLAAEAQQQEEMRRAAEEQAQRDAIERPTDIRGIQMNSLAKNAEEIKVQQSKLLADLNAALEIKNEDLKNLREDNDLSEQGKFVAPRPFKSVTAENQKIEELKLELDNTINARQDKIEKLEIAYRARLKEVNNPNDEINNYYKNTITELKNEQVAAERSRAYLLSTLKEVAKATDFERKRRIKRASYNNETDRYAQNRAQLNIIKQGTPLSSTPLRIEDFDFGEERNTNIQILKNVANTDNGYYMIVAVHNSVTKRDDFLTKVVASGNKDIDFFFDVNTSKYYIYTRKYNSIEEANVALETKQNDPYNHKMSILKIEN